MHAVWPSAPHIPAFRLGNRIARGFGTEALSRVSTCSSGNRQHEFAVRESSDQPSDRGLDTAYELDLDRQRNCELCLHGVVDALGEHRND